MKLPRWKWCNPHMKIFLNYGCLYIIYRWILKISRSLDSSKYHMILSGQAFWCVKRRNAMSRTSTQSHTSPSPSLSRISKHSSKQEWLEFHSSINSSFQCFETNKTLLNHVLVWDWDRKEFDFWFFNLIHSKIILFLEKYLIQI